MSREEFSREEIEEAKQRIQRREQYRLLFEYLDRQGRAEAIAREEMEAEEAGRGTSDEVSKEQAIRLMLEDACKDVRAGCDCGFEPGTYPSKVKVAKHMNLSAGRIKQLWMGVRNAGEEWPPC
ncbi:MAG TPA: hypothetical protein VF071_01240 [Candidatus Limnocylindria bacterium]